MIHGKSAHLLGGHVADGAEHDTRLRRRRHRGGCAHRRERRLILGQLRQSEVENLDAIVPGDEHVFRLEIAMRDPFFVRRREAARDLQRILNRLANGDRATPRPLSKRLAFEQLGHDERRTGHQCRCRTPRGCSGGSAPRPRGLPARIDGGDRRRQRMPLGSTLIATSRPSRGSRAR